MIKRLLLVLCTMLITSNVYATNVTWEPLVSSDDVSIQRLNDIHNVFGNNLVSIPGDNIQSKSISADALSNNASPLPRWADTFSNFVVTGLLAPTGASLTQTTTAGRALVTDTVNNLMNYVQKDATANTYTAGVWTWVDINHNGTYTYSETSQGAAEPAVTTNSIRLFKVSADSTSGVGEVTDLRVIGGSLSTGEDFLIRGMELRVVSPDNMVTVDTGVYYHGTTRIEKTSQVGLRLGTASDWWDGVADSYGSAGWTYIGGDSSGSIKFLGDNAPNVDDTDKNTGGDVSRYWNDGTKTWRVLGQAKVSADDTIASSMYQTGNMVMWGFPEFLTSTASAGAWSSALDCSPGIPATSKLGIFGLQAVDNDTELQVSIRPNGSIWPSNTYNGIATEASSTAGTQALSGQRTCATDTSQQIQYFNGSGDASTNIFVEGFYLQIRD